MRSSGCLYNIPIITDFEKYLHTLDKTLEMLKDIYFQPNGLVYKNANNNKYTVSALIFFNNYFLPIVETEYSKTELDSLMPSNYYLSSLMHLCNQLLHHNLLI